MSESAENHDRSPLDRLARVETRLAELEAALARMCGLPELAASDDHCAKTQKLAALDSTKTDPPPASSGLGITAAFATLDADVAAAADHESSLARKPDLSHIVPINENLIEDSFAQRVRPRAVRAPGNGRRKTALEELHPKLLLRLTMTWRSTEGYDYLKRLIIDDRGDRKGFDPATMSELLFLSAILDTPVDENAWAANARAV